MSSVWQKLGILAAVIVAIPILRSLPIPWTHVWGFVTALPLWSLALAGGSLVLLGVSIRKNRKAQQLQEEWRKWKQQFAFAGRGSKIDITKISGKPRDMSQKYVAVKRSARTPFRFDLEDKHQRQVPDLADYLKKNLATPAWKGLLLMAEPAVGKSRFLAEVIRSYAPDTLVLAPGVENPNRLVCPTPPAEHEDFIIFLDDIERFRSDTTPVEGLLSALGSKAKIIATVRFAREQEQLGDPGSIPRRFWSELEILQLDRPSEAARQKIARANDIDPSQIILPDLGFLLKDQIESARQRYQDLSHPARRCFRSAAQLFNAGIEITNDRWKMICDLDSESFEKAVTSTIQCFGEEGRILDEYLRFVPTTVWFDEDNTSIIRQRLVASKDSIALRQWAEAENRSGAGIGGTKHFENAIELFTAALSAADPESLIYPSLEFGIGVGCWSIGLLDQSEAWWRKAIVDGRKTGTPDGLVMASRAGHNLGVLLNDTGSDEARSAYQNAIEDGRKAGTTDGLVAASWAGLSLGTLLKETEPDEARSAWESSIQDGRKAGTPIGLTLTSEAWSHLGTLLKDTDMVEARSAYENAVQDGRKAGTPHGLTMASDAGGDLGILLKDFDLVEARSACGKAIEDGHKAGTPDGLALASRAGYCLGIFLRKTDPDEARVLYQKAIEDGHKAGTPDGLVMASTAEYNLGDLLSATDPDEARSAYQKAIEHGHKAGTPDGLAAASKAGCSLGFLLRDVEPDEARVHYQKAIEDGHKAGTPDGLVIASQGRNYLGLLLKDAEPDEARVLFQKAIEDGHKGDAPYGLATASWAGSNLGILLKDTDPDEARAAWQKAVNDGRTAGTTDGLGSASWAGYNLGFFLRDTGDLPGACAVWKAAFQDAVTADTESACSLAESLKTALNQHCGSG